MRTRRWLVVGVIATVVVLMAAACDFQGISSAVSVPAPGGTSAADDLQAMACLPSGWCLAAGSVAMVRTGTNWSDIAAPPERVTHVACSSTTDCLAIGDVLGYASSHTYFLEHFDGTTWTTLSWLESDSLNAVACTPSADCVVFGSSGSGEVADQWDGTNLTAMTLPADPASVGDVSCPTASFCLAVGAAAPVYVDPAAMEWTGGPSWATVPLAGSSVTYIPTHVSCESATFCEATNGTDYQVGTWDGTTLTFDAGQGFNDFRQGWGLISCPTATAGDCEHSSLSESECECTPQVASVSRQDGTGSDLTLGSEIYGLYCMSASSCVALGQDPTTFGRQAWHYNGTSWSHDTFSGPVDADTLAESLSCPTTSFCMMGGSYAYGGYRNPYVRRWNGSTWTTTPLLPAGSENDVQVGCLSATDCVAATSGNQAYQVGSSNMVATWDGTSWTHQPTADGATAVACTGASFCLLANGAKWWTWNGTTLSGPTSYTPFGVAFMSCSSATHCVLASGANLHGFDDWPPLLTYPSELITWNGTTMSAPVAAPAPAGQIAELTGLSCPSGGACRAVGGVGVQDSLAPSPYVIEGDNATWSPVSIPATGPGYLAGVSCASSSECLAVGNGTVKSSPDSELLLAESGAGSWYNAPDLPASGSVPVSYDHIACLSLWCAAVGSHTDNGHPTVTSAFYTWTDSTN